MGHPLRFETHPPHSCITVQKRCGLRKRLVERQGESVDDEAMAERARDLVNGFRGPGSLG